MATFRQAATPPAEVKAELLAVGVGTGMALSAAAGQVDEALGGRLAQHLQSIHFSGKPGETAMLPAGGGVAAQTVIVVGLGDTSKITHEEIRQAAGVVARRAEGFDSVALALGGGVPSGPEAAAQGYALGAYRFTTYKTDKGSAPAGDVLLVGEASDEEMRRAAIVSDATNWARDLVNEPAGFRGPSRFADRAKERAEAAGLEVEILDENAMAAKGMNGVLTVGQGAATPPRFLILRYEPEGAKGFVGLIGKGITFDSGGLSIKPAESMETMKTDCSGGAAVAAAMSALPALGPRIRVVGAVPLAENMPGGRAVKPGDVIRHYGGHTSEVLNTDAEGRLVLADALAWMAEQNPDAMIDLATLTGGMMVALGKKVTGFFANRDSLADEMLAAGERTGERLWRMPLLDDLRSEIDSDVADVKNTGARYGSPIFGALFLRDFIGDTAWAHLDIAGPARSDKDEHYVSKGATGVGTRLVIDWVEHRAKN
ncbi:MAG TPA: leucyl aminopeptidase [Actinomycetota bacterium]